ncbi:protein FAR1-RELATED SEQUENCE 2-like [Salvia miltiorrhiza]|uniref:protein FAR1-RELATED SEQUENCE 2-like n=1 Tax=Salvia miltiorrhiza TaxID=226208 RepID=UPI0025AD3F43|nr:protein FAR1-RELATED SEQUENCE 2-like [Salvia miltiorrhiza]
MVAKSLATKASMAEQFLQSSFAAKTLDPKQVVLVEKLQDIDEDAAAIANLFKTLRKEDPSFHHMMDIDEDMTLHNVMWVHPRSKAAYEEFHDVVSFDTTYLVNRYHMPFATVVGINHHHQSILLGCALLTHEQSESFKWFFSNWLDAMGGVAPTAILTDQCESIKNALKELMPDTIHRFCIWHILHKLPDKFKAIKESNKAQTAFKNIVYDSLSIGKFEGRSTLKAFVEQYEIAITNKTHKELEADFKSKSTHITRRTQFEWEDQFGRVYTNNVFELFQKEIDKMVCCNLTVVQRSLADVLNEIERYEVRENEIIGNCYHKEYVYRVEHRSKGGYFECECKKFKSKVFEKSVFYIRIMWDFISVFEYEYLNNLR